MRPAVSSVAVVYEMQVKYLEAFCSSVIDISTYDNMHIEKEFTLLSLKGLSEVFFSRNFFSQFPLK